MMSGYSPSIFSAYYLGMIENVNLGSVSAHKSDVQLIDRVEEAQLEGKIPLFPEDELVKIEISKSGIKVMDHLQKEVMQRHPLHSVAQIVSFTDAFSKSNLVVKIGQFGRRVFDCYVFQCRSEEQARSISDCMTAVFDSVNDQESL